MAALHITSMDMIRRAASAATDCIVAHLAGYKPGTTHWHIVTGSGKNAADGFYVGKYLLEWEIANTVTFHCLVPPEKLKNEAENAYNDVRGVPSGKFCTSLATDDFSADGRHIIVDALLGTGLKGDVRPEYAAWIRLINEIRTTVISIDIPSGLSADTGTALPCAIQAELTLTMGVLKYGLLSQIGCRHCGKIVCVDIGVPKTIADVYPQRFDLVDREVAASLLRRFDVDTYKQKRGHLLVIGGSADYPSAPLLSAEAALRMGAGLVTAVLPGRTEVFTSVPKALILRKTPSQAGHFTPEDVPFITDLLKSKDAVIIGPGLTTHPETKEFLQQLLPLLSLPKVIDADALNLLAEMESHNIPDAENTVLTPHCGEIARLLKPLDVKDLTELDAVQALAGKYHCNCMLKGPHSTCLNVRTGRVSRNLSGSPALATAGSGDVLSGMIGALLTQGYVPFHALQLGVWLHGSIPELWKNAADNGFPCGLTADDLVYPGIPIALNDLAGFNNFPGNAPGGRDLCNRLQASQRDAQLADFSDIPDNAPGGRDLKTSANHTI